MDRPGTFPGDPTLGVTMRKGLLLLAALLLTAAVPSSTVAQTGTFIGDALSQPLVPLQSITRTATAQPAAPAKAAPKAKRTKKARKSSKGKKKKT